MRYFPGIFMLGLNGQQNLAATHFRAKATDSK
jgi:hypothetical protein